MSLFTWPFKRKQYAGLGNPRFVGDIVAANEAINDALAAIIGTTNIAAGGTLIIGQSYVVMGGSITYNSSLYTVGQVFTAVAGFTTFTTSAGGYVVSNDFFIVSGLDFIGGVTNTFNPGIFYLQGQFYIINAPFTEGLYLAANPTDTMPQPFGDGNSRNIYTLMQAVTTSTPSGTTTPEFLGNMNAYRIGLKYINTLIQALVVTTSSLGSAAFKTVTNTPTAGQIPYWDNLYTKTQISNGFLKIDGSNGPMTGPLVLNADPTDAKGAATKSYVDSQGAKRLVSGNTVVGDISSSNTNVTVSLGTTLADNNYLVLITVISLGTPGNDATTIFVVHNKTTTGFDVLFHEVASVVQDISIDWVVFHF